jgi:hypothetical protein
MNTFTARLLEVAKKRTVIAGSVAVVAFAAGTGSGYFYARKKLIGEFDEKMEAEIERTSEWLERKYKKQAKADEFATPESAAEALGVEVEEEPSSVEKASEAFERYHPEMPIPNDVRTVKHPLATTPRQVNRNIFTDPQPVEGVDFNYDEEVAARSSERPYIISAEEFEAGEFDKVCLTWYSGDDVLTDDQDTIIPDFEYEKYIGSEDNLRFGHRSDQNHIVYIRSEKVEIDFEVARHGGKYSVAVAGFTEDERPTQEPIRRPMARASRGDSE